MRGGMLVIVGLLVLSAALTTATADDALLPPRGLDKNFVRTAAEWPARREQILAAFEQIAGPLPSRENLPPLDVQVFDDSRQAGIRRQTISYVSERAADGGVDRVTALLWIPDTPADERRPAVVALHPTGEAGKLIVAGEGKANRQYGLELAQRGYIVLAPDYPSFGGLKSYDFAADPHVSGTMKAIVNHMRGIDLLAARDDVDAARIGALGHSLGGHNAVFLGMFDTRVRVVVTSCGWCPFHDYKQGNLAGWAQDRYMPRVRDVFKSDPAQLPCEFEELVAAIAPRAFMTISPLADSNFAVNGVQRVMPRVAEVYELLGAPENVEARYPDCEHDFSPAARQEAYAFLDRALAHTPAALPAVAESQRMKVFVPSTADGRAQPCYVITPPGYEPHGELRPLVVSLHTWSGNVEQRQRELEEAVAAKGWFYLFPDFRGRNDQPEACGSELAQQDILDAVEWTARRWPIDRDRIYLTGTSGGGHMTMLMAGRHPRVWAAASAWVGISDLASWHQRHADDKYGEMLRACCGGPPGASAAVDQQYRARSPLTHMAAARDVPLDLAAGVHDGHQGSVPIRHTLDAFNAIASANGAPMVNPAEIEQLSRKDGRLDAPQAGDLVEDPAFGRAIYLRRRAGPARVTIFEGGHEGIASAAVDWLGRHRRPPAAKSPARQ